MAESKFLKHIPCEECGSSDGNSLYDDGHEYCHVCQTWKAGEETQLISNNFIYESKPKGIKMQIKGEVQAIQDRGILRSSAEFYGVTNYLGNHYYPYADESGAVVAAKVRNVENKDFHVEGQWGKATLFGQQKFPKGGKFLTIVEGELDALAAFQMCGSKYPCVSIRNGAQAAAKDIRANFEYIDSFESVVICFDNDEAGKKAALECASIIGSKAKVFKGTTDFKDACDYLKAGKTTEFVNLWWKSEEWKPEGIVTVADIEDRLLTPPTPGVPWCFPTLTELTYGRRKGELYGFGAGVGVGKTDVFTQQIAFDVEVLQEKVGVIYLEQNVVETAQRVAGKLDKRLYHVPDADWTREQYVASISRLKQRNQLYMMEHFGSMDWTTIKGIIRYFAKAYDIKMIYLDHLTALSANEQDERRALDGIMADMASLAQQDGLIIHFISHLTTPDGKPHEEGGRVMEKHFTGSRAIARWSHYMFGLERDKQHEDPLMRQTTTFRVLKDRFTGRATAEKFGLRYDKNTGILSECELIDETL